MPPYERGNSTTSGSRESRSWAGVCAGQAVEDVNKLADERLTLDTKQKVLEIVVREINSPVGVAPQLHGRDVRLFFSHTILDSYISRRWATLEPVFP